MSRRFLGCALRVAGKDEWFPKDERLWRGKEHRALLKPRQAYALASKMQEPESVRVVWVFATRKPKPAPATGRSVPAAEVTRLRAALASIAALQTESPKCTGLAEIHARAGRHDDAYLTGFEEGIARGKHAASSLAAKALGGGT